MIIIPIDSSSLISLSTNCMLGILDKLHEELKIQFLITPDIKKEVVDTAMNIDKFRLGAVRIMKRLCNGIINVEKTDYFETKKLLEIANNIFKVNGKPLSIIHEGEISLVHLSKTHSSNLLMTDERIMDKLINDPLGLKEIIENRMHTSIGINNDNLSIFKELIKNILIMKSSDLLAIAFEKNLLNDFTKGFIGKKIKKDFINGALWGLKVNGCAISTLDIEEYMHVLFP